MVRNSGKTNVRKSGYIFEYRFTLLGGGRAGKTSIMNRFMSNTFTHRYRPTIEDHITHTIDHKGNICVCLLVDTCGGNDFPAMKRLAISKGNAFLLVYAIDNRKSFIEAKRTADEIISLKNPSEDVKIMLIGNKVDLESEREVYRHEGEELNEELNTGNVSSLFFEVSAMDGTCVTDIFTSLLNMFIPEQAAVTQTPERSTFSRMSFRRRSKKKNQKRKQQSLDNLLSETNYLSDTESETHHNKSQSLQPRSKPQLIRSSSATSHSSESSDCADASPNASPLFGRRETMIHRESSAKEILKKTFGSMQRLFVKPSEHNNNNNNNNNNNLLVRSATSDSIIRGRNKKETAV